MAQLSERDWILLNAYLDGELSPQERSAFQARLDQDPVLQAELISLRQTIEWVRMTPRLPIPRNFTLDPAVYGKPSRRSRAEWQRGLSWVASAAGALIGVVLICGGTLLVMRGTISPNLGMAVPQGAARSEVVYEVAEEEIEALESDRAEAETMDEPLVEAEAPMEAMPYERPPAEEGNGVAEPAPAAEASVEGTPAPPPEEEQTVAEEAAPMPEAGGGLGGGPEGGDGEPPPDVFSPTEDAMAAVVATPTQSLAPRLPTETPMPSPTSAPLPTPVPTSPSPTPFRGNIPASVVFIAVGVGIITLGVLMLGAIIFAWIVRRRR